MTSSDYLKLLEHKIFKNVRETLRKGIKKTENIMCIQEDMLYIWDFQDNCVLTLNIKATRSRDGDNIIHQTLLPMSSPLFTPERLIVNKFNTILVVFGPNGVLVFELPARCPPHGCFANNKELIYCRSFSLIERSLAFSNHIEVRQVRFHPASLQETHVTMLTSDNIIRIFNIENSAIQTGVYGVGVQPTGRFPTSQVSYLEVFGETAVDFAFAPPEIKDVYKVVKPEFYKNLNKSMSALQVSMQNQNQTRKTQLKGNEMIWPVFILYGTGEVFISRIVLEDKANPPLEGPIPIFPKGNINYGTDCCAILCIESTPPMLSITKCNGTIYHAIILDNPEPPTMLKSPGNKTDGLPAYQRPSNKVMCVTETVELELGLATTYEEVQYSCPIYLYTDPSVLGYYFAIHETGVHYIRIPYISDLHDFLVERDDADIFEDFLNHGSTAEYMVCTKTATSEKINAVIGFSQYFDPSSIIILLADGQVLSLPLFYGYSAGGISGEGYGFEDMENMTSPLKKMLSNPFDMHVQKILKQSRNQPILKLPSNTDSSQQECYELFQRASQVFREEHFKHHDKAREEIEKRVKALAMLKNFQANEIRRMTEEKHEMQETAENLAEKYEDIKDKQEDLSKRCEKLLILISKRQAVPSNAEKKYQQELNESNARLVKYANAISKLRNKMKYQELQMQNWQSQNKKVVGIGAAQSQSIKINLQDMTNKITNMIIDVNDYKKNLNIT